MFRRSGTGSRPRTLPDPERPSRAGCLYPFSRHIASVIRCKRDAHRIRRNEVDARSRPLARARVRRRRWGPPPANLDPGSTDHETTGPRDRPPARLAASSPTGAEVVVDGRAFRVPDGFVVEKVAGPPLVDRPIVADFDERGRLYVADSSGSNDNVKKQLEDRPHRIVRLEDADGDGKFDRSTVFADRMMFPEGAMWLDGSLYVVGPAVDLEADRHRRRRRGRPPRGVVPGQDPHRLRQRPPRPLCRPRRPGLLVQGGLRPADLRPARPQAAFDTRAAHIFRARPDGTGIEPVMTGGMDNPVDVAFTPEGERIFTTTFLQHPGGGRRDGLIHALYGGVYGKVHDVIDGHPRTGPDVLPPLVHLGPAAPCGPGPGRVGRPRARATPSSPPASTSARSPATS